jgi:hypothetical protein
MEHQKVSEGRNSINSLGREVSRSILGSKGWKDECQNTLTVNRGKDHIFKDMASKGKSFLLNVTQNESYD